MKTKKVVIALLIAAALLFFAAAAAVYYKTNIAVPPRPTDAMTVTIIDVGQGSSTLVQAGDSDILIDCGEESTGRDVCDALHSAGVTSLDAVIVTHLHSDHYGGLADVLAKYPVAEIIEPATPQELLPDLPSYRRMLEAIEKHSTPVTVCDKFGMRILAQNVSLTFLDGFLDEPDGLNNTSLTMRIDCKNISLLITGDAETAVEDRLRETDAEALDCDLLVAGHHGSGTSSRQYFLNAVKPVASFISVGLNNGYDLPNDGTVERLAAFGPIYRTDINGTIRVTTDGDTVRVRTARLDDTLPGKEESTEALAAKTA